MTSGCPNDDPAFTRVLSGMFGSSAVTADLRRFLFYGVCIWVRAALYTGVWFYRDKPWVIIAVGAASLFALITLARSLARVNPGRQWWSKWFQLAMAAALVAATTARHVFPRQVPDWVVPALLFTSLGGGILQSLLTSFC